MSIVLQMAVRNALPDALNAAARRAGRADQYSFDENAPIWLRRPVAWAHVPREGETVYVMEFAEPPAVERVHWQEGTALVMLTDFDADEIGDEATVIEELLEVGWQIDFGDEDP